MPLDDTQLFDAPPPGTIQPQNPDYVPAYQEQPAHWRYDLDPISGVCRASYSGIVFAGDPANAGNQVATKADIAASTTGVASFNARTGVVTLTLADVTGVGGAPINSPTLAGTPNAPTPAPGDNTTRIATTMFVTSAVAAAAGVASFNGRLGAVTLTTGDVTGAGGAPQASPTLTGIPTAPTAAQGTSSPQIATTAFVLNQIAGGAVASWNGRQGVVSLQLSDVTGVGGAPLDSPAFTGNPTSVTAAPGNSTTRIATTAFVTNALSAATAGVASFNTRTGAVTLQLSDVTGAGGAPSVSPALTGTPTAPTATAGTATQQLATTAFVANALTGLPGVASFNGRQGAVTLQLADVTSVGGAPLASPGLTGSPLSTTPPPGDNSTRIATTSFVQTSFAPLTSPVFTGNPQVPTQSPGDADTSAASTAFVAAAVAQVSPGANNNTGRNLVHNALMTVAQRGAGPFTGSAYTLDRWFLSLSLDTSTVSQAAVSDAIRAAIGDEAATNMLSISVAGNAGATAFTFVVQKIESIRRLAGKTVTVSFWASATGATKLGINLLQDFGSGGSPSAGVWLTAVPLTLSGTWTRYSATFVVPSASGKTLGTNGNDETSLTFWVSSGANNATIAGNPGVQTGTVQLWGVQLETGSVATPLDYGGSPQQQLAQCQRYFERFDWPTGGNIGLGTTAQSPPNAYFTVVPFKVAKRVAPTMTSSAASTFNAAGVGAASISLASDVYAVKFDLGLSSGGGANWDAFFISANTGAWLAASADL